MNTNDQFIGIVEGNRLRLLWPESPLGQSVRLTTIQIQESLPPDAREVNLGDYEGQAIMVQGHLDSDWIYAARVIDQAGPILTVAVRNLFGGKGI